MPRPNQNLNSDFGQRLCARRPRHIKPKPQIQKSQTRHHHSSQSQRQNLQSNLLLLLVQFSRLKWSKKRNPAKMATRYNSYDLRSSTSSYLSDPASSSFELKPQNQPTSSSRAIIKSKPSTAATKTNKNNNTNLANMVKKFMEKKSSSSSRAVGLVIPSDVIAEDLKKTARKGGNFGGLQRKLFGGKIENEKKSEVKALPLREVKGGGGNNNVNARTLAMVLRSERELLNANKEQCIEISQLKMLLQEKNNEVSYIYNISWVPHP